MFTDYCVCMLRCLLGMEWVAIGWKKTLPSFHTRIWRAPNYGSSLLKGKGREAGMIEPCIHIQAVAPRACPLRRRSIIPNLHTPLTFTTAYWP